MKMTKLFQTKSNSAKLSVNLLIQPEFRKIRTRKTSVFGHFSHSEWIKGVIIVYVVA